VTISSIKALVDTYDTATLIAAEQALLNDEPLPIDVQGSDAGEQLTHVLAALWVLHDMHDNKTDASTSIRAYTKRVRTSIL
jgi:hypothetical protein